MKPLYKLTDRSKVVFLNKIVHDIMDSINDRINLWFENSYILKQVGESDEISLSNLKDDLDYLFTKGIWFIDQNKTIDKCTIDFFKTLYNNYTSSDVGFRLLINHKQYNLKENKLMTKAESIVYHKKINDYAIKLLNDLDI